MINHLSNQELFVSTLVVFAVIAVVAALVMVGIVVWLRRTGDTTANREFSRFLDWAMREKLDTSLVSYINEGAYRFTSSETQAAFSAWLARSGVR
ncbi:TPA: hypothetical protein ACP7Q5_004904 [Escherichia coli]|jgi:type II secretory pathway pseudopilin PulG|nr:MULTISPECIES: hypothetical protein [Bacilli]ELG7156058.1 hypothetical protein [Staphylococcus aureus]ELL1200976.1 hypothetical protein [Staphylococcus aureus]MDH9287428.1 hypothetical protein [Staphylococcus epidermidis]MDH9530793.1 hypothetical protein [Staphylococcus epidermidis]MDN3101412.1 hypothetical protein [Enterococcus faecalis]